MLLQQSHTVLVPCDESENSTAYDRSNNMVGKKKSLSAPNMNQDSTHLEQYAECACIK